LPFVHIEPERQRTGSVPQGKIPDFSQRDKLAAVVGFEKLNEVHLHIVSAGSDSQANGGGGFPLSVSVINVYKTFLHDLIVQRCGNFVKYCRFTILKI